MCPTMKCFGDLTLDQPRENIERLTCMHSKAADYLADDYDDNWLVPIPDEHDETHKITVNEDIKVQCLIDQQLELFLVAYQAAGSISVLFAVSKNRKFPCVHHV